VRPAVLLVAVVVLAGCGGRSSHGGGASTSDDPRAGGKDADLSVIDELGGVQRTDTIVVDRGGIAAIRLRQTPASRAAAAAFARAADATRVPVDGLPGAVGFRADPQRTARLLGPRRGAYVIRYDDETNGPDAILVLPTADPWTAVRAAGTAGVNSDVSNADVVRWLRELDRTHPFTLTVASSDQVEGRFAHAPRGQDALALARRMYRFDPDIVDQGTGSVRGLARVLERRGTLYLWWD
jgi:hypothetical protein